MVLLTPDLYISTMVHSGVIYAYKCHRQRHYSIIAMYAPSSSRLSMQETKTLNGLVFRLRSDRSIIAA